MGVIEDIQKRAADAAKQKEEEKKKKGAVEVKGLSKEEFAKVVEERQRATGTGEYARGGTKDVFAEQIAKAETQVAAERAVIEEKQKASGGLTAGKRLPSGERVTRVEGVRPVATDEEVAAKQKEIITQRAEVEVQRQREQERQAREAGQPIQTTPGTYQRLASELGVYKEQSAKAREEQRLREEQRRKEQEKRQETITQSLVITGGPEPGAPPGTQEFTFEKKATIDPYAETAYEIVYKEEQVGEQIISTPVGVKPRVGSGLTGTYSVPTELPSGDYTFQYTPGAGEEAKLGQVVSISLRPETAGSLRAEAIQALSREGGTITPERVEGKVVELLQTKYAAGVPVPPTAQEKATDANTAYAAFKANQIITAAEKGETSPFTLTAEDQKLLVAAGNKPEDVKSISEFGGLLKAQSEQAKAIEAANTQAQEDFKKTQQGYIDRASELGYTGSFREPTAEELSTKTYQPGEFVFELKPTPGKTQYYIAGTSTASYIEFGKTAEGEEFTTLGGYKPGEKVALTRTSAKGEVKPAVQAPLPAEFAQGFRDPTAQGIGAIGGFFFGEQAGKDVEKATADILFGVRGTIKSYGVPLPGEYYTTQQALIQSGEIVEKPLEKPKQIRGRKITKTSTIQLNPEDLAVIAKVTQERPGILAGEIATEAGITYATAGVAPAAVKGAQLTATGVKIVAGVVKKEGTIVLKVTKPFKYGTKAELLLTKGEQQTGKVSKVVEKVKTTAQTLKREGISGVKPAAQQLFDISKIELQYVKRAEPVVSATTRRIETELAQDVAIAPRGLAPEEVVRTGVARQPKPTTTQQKELTKLQTEKEVAQAKGDVDQLIRIEDREAALRAEVARQSDPFLRTPEGIKRIEDTIFQDPAIRQKVGKTQQLIDNEAAKLDDIAREFDEINAQRVQLDNQEAAIRSQLDEANAAPEPDNKLIKDLEKQLDNIDKERIQLGRRELKVNERAAKINEKIEEIRQRRALKRHDVLGAKERRFRTEITRMDTPLRRAEKKGITKKTAAGLPQTGMTGAKLTEDIFRIERTPAKERAIKEIRKGRPEREARREEAARIRESTSPLVTLELEREAAMPLKPKKLGQQQRVRAAIESFQLLKTVEPGVREEPRKPKPTVKGRRPKFISEEPEFLILPPGVEAPRKPTRGISEAPTVTVKKVPAAGFEPLPPKLFFQEPAIAPELIPRIDEPLKPVKPAAVRVKVDTRQTQARIQTPKQEEAFKLVLEEKVVTKQRPAEVTKPVQKPVTRVPPKVPPGIGMPLPPLGGGGSLFPGRGPPDVSGVRIKQHAVENVLFPSFSLTETGEFKYKDQDDDTISLGEEFGVDFIGRDVAGHVPKKKKKGPAGLFDGLI